MDTIFVALRCLYKISHSFAYDLGVGYNTSVCFECFHRMERPGEMAIV
jgi:hypothetical protein